MKTVFKLTVLAALLWGCVAENPATKVLDEVETYIVERPYDALMVLQDLNPSMMEGKRVQAKYSLLISMAMESNALYPDNFSYLQPAMDFYLKKGNPDEKLRTFYLMGRICENTGDFQGAMESYVKGLAEASGTKDAATAAKMHYAKGNMHRSLRQWDKHVLHMKEAAALFEECGDYTLCFDSWANVFSGYVAMESREDAAQVLENLQTMADRENPNELSLLYESKVAFAGEFVGKQALAELLQEYVEVVPHSYVGWLTVAEKRLEMKDLHGCRQALDSYCLYSMDRSMKYHHIASRLYEEYGDAEAAVEHYSMYVSASDSVGKALLLNDTKFIEERYALMREARVRKMTSLLAAGFIVLLAGVIAVIVYRLKVRLKENDSYRQQCQMLMQEKSTLAQTLEESLVLNGDMKGIVRERLALLNKFLAANITENWKADKSAQQQMDELLSNREEFIASTISAFEASHPSFMSYLKGRGLTEKELGYCCLYAIGLNGKEVGAFTKMSRHYIVNSEIRKKLGLSEQKTNLDKYIQQLLDSDSYSG
jgi:tetratricopeptide (TPR) repeat protein